MSGAKLTEDQRRKIIDAVSKGVHPTVACTAAGLSKSYWKQLRYRARAGEQVAQQLLAEVEAAEAQGEIADVEATARAVEPVDQQDICCPTCGEEFTARPEQIAAMAARLTDIAKAKGIAGEVAIKKLERRHPARWSQKVIHTVQEEHQRLLDVCQRVLAPEVFESLLEEYLAGECGESAAAGSQSEPTGGGVH